MVNLDEVINIKCPHYDCRCMIQSPCCKLIFWCRICHDEYYANMDPANVEQKEHQIDSQCRHFQQVQERCEECGQKFGEYSCNVCRLYDNNTSKKQFHCEKCGICRIGGRENFFHCIECNYCMPNSSKDNHKCFKDNQRRQCLICLEELFESRDTSHIPKCGHLIHSKCFKKSLEHGNYRCPTCKQAMFDMTDHYKNLTTAIEAQPMPPQYIDKKLDITCNDCHQKSKEVPFHFLGNQCSQCNSYNTDIDKYLWD